MTNQSAHRGACVLSTCGQSLQQAIAAVGIHLRPVCVQDEQFLRDLYASTRWDELAPTGWPDDAKRTFLSQQWHAQSQYYGKHYAAADHLAIVHAGGARIGRLFVDWHDDVRLVDIALMAAWRGMGIGTIILEALCQQADQLRRPVIAHVETFNPARRLYERLGFVVEDDNQIYLRMRRKALALEATA